MSERDTMHRQSDLPLLHGMIQCDLATNLFAVFIAILAALQIIVIAATTTGFKLRVTPEPYGPLQQLGLVRSWHPVQPINKKILIRNERAIGLNLTPIAKGLATGVRQFADTDEVTDQSQPRIADRAPSAFVLLLHLDPSTTFPQELVTWSVNIAPDKAPTIPEDVQRWVDEAQSIDIYVSVGQDDVAWQLAAVLSKLNVPLRIQILKSKTAFGFSRRTKYFGFEGVYK